MTPHAINDPKVRSVRMSFYDFEEGVIHDPIGFYRIMADLGMLPQADLEVVIFTQDSRTLTFEEDGQ